MSILENAGRLFSIFMILVLSTTVAYAMPLNGDSSASTSGLMNVQAAEATGQLDANIEYAVYAPGNYPGNDPSSGNEWVYAYQAFNNSTGSVELSQLSVGRLSGSTVNNVGHDSTYGTLSASQVPTLMLETSSSVVWNFLSSLINPGEFSDVLLFTSPNSWSTGPGSVQNGGLSQTTTLPTPVPEPATMLILSLGSMAMVGMRRRRRQA